MPDPETRLNGICPYFTMFPLEFPYTILRRHARANERILDPFCGRGTTNFASRLLGLPSIGIDSSPVAVALSQAKLASTSSALILRVTRHILEEVPDPQEIPEGEFWDWAFHAETLHTLCRLREGLLRNCRSDTRRALRAILLGALHGPRPKGAPSYLSNQAPRTYAPKPRYAVTFWKAHNLHPEPVAVMPLIAVRAHRYYSMVLASPGGSIIQGDSRTEQPFRQLARHGRISWVVTSPPYYGMRTYLPDQWLRMWFLGGPATVDYSMSGQVTHRSPEVFAQELHQVWRQVGTVCTPGAHLVVRFGSINDRHVDAPALLRHSLQETGWRITTARSAGSAAAGRRQMLHFSRSKKGALAEQDVWATWEH